MQVNRVCPINGHKVIYNNDGTGRDRYIYLDNGGF